MVMVRVISYIGRGKKEPLQTPKEMKKSNKHIRALQTIQNMLCPLAVLITARGHQWLLGHSQL